MSDTSEPRRLPPEQRREEILSAAVQLFCEKGYEGTTIKDIARAIGVTEGLLYHYFSGKADLIAECWRRRSWHTRACAIVEQAGDRPFGEVVSDLVRDHLDSLYSNGPAFRMHAAEMLRDGELASFSQQYIHETRKLIASYLRGLQARARIRPDADPEVVADLIIGSSTFQFVVHGRLPRDEWDALVSHAAEEFSRLLVRSLATNSPTAS